MVSQKVGVLDGSMPLLHGAASTLLRLIKKHTSLDEAQLRIEAQTALDDPGVYDACFRAAVKNGWIEPGGELRPKVGDGMKG